MSKYKPIQISIPQPCSEDWQKMTPQDKGRYCDACKKCVVDFTGFSDRQLYDYFIQHANEKICGRFHNTQLNRPINIPPQPHSKLYRIAVALGLAIAVVTSAEQKSFAKAPLVEYSFIDNYNTDDTTKNNTDSTYATIKGQVVDENGKPLMNAVVELVLGGIVKAGTITDYNGNYKLNNIQLGNNYNLRVKYTGYKVKIVDNIQAVEEQITIYNVMMDLEKKQPDVITITAGNMAYHSVDIDTPVERTFTQETLEGNLLIRDVLIDTDNPSAGNKTITSEQIEKTAH